MHSLRTFFFLMMPLGNGGSGFRSSFLIYLLSRYDAVVSFLSSPVSMAGYASFMDPVLGQRHSRLPPKEEAVEA